MDKSIISQSGLSQIEFAKRLFHNGDEISGIKFTILKEASRNIKLLPDLIKLMNLRGYQPNLDQFVPEHIPSDKLRTYATILLNESGWQVPPYGVTLVPTF